MVETALKNFIKVAPYITQMPSEHIWFDYDRKADVLYVSFEKPQQAADTEITDKGILIRKRGDKIVGLTIINASTL